MYNSQVEHIQTHQSQYLVLQALVVQVEAQAAKMPPELEQVVEADLMLYQDPKVALEVMVESRLILPQEMLLSPYPSAPSKLLKKEPAYRLTGLLILN